MEHTIEELIDMPKKVDGPKLEYDAPAPGKALEVKLMSPEDLSCKFTMSIYEGKHSSSLVMAIEPGRKTTMQTRHRSDALVRVDMDDKAKHTNPDGTVIEGSHVHIAKEGYGDTMRIRLIAQKRSASSVKAGNSLPFSKRFGNTVILIGSCA